MTQPGANDNGNVPDEAPPTARPGREPPQPLPKRFYQQAQAEPVAGGHAILLDGRAVKTPRKLSLVVPSRDLAVEIAAEWAAQGERIDPQSMPLTRLANTALDAVADHAGAVRADIVSYAASDALLYRASEPIELAERQAAAWDPVLTWAAQSLNAQFVPATGIIHVAQPEAALAAMAAALEPYDGWRLAPLHVITTLTGSALLAIAVAHAALPVNEAWAAAHVDEDFQISRWGSDDEAEARRAHRWAQMQSAARFFALAGPV
jgi:chaperone required for assembly of F1-ATPase